MERRVQPLRRHLCRKGCRIPPLRQRTPSAHVARTRFRVAAPAWHTNRRRHLLGRALRQQHYRAGEDKSCIRNKLRQGHTACGRNRRPRHQPRQQIIPHRSRCAACMDAAQGIYGVRHLRRRRAVPHLARPLRLFSFRHRLLRLIALVHACRRKGRHHSTSVQRLLGRRKRRLQQHPPHAHAFGAILLIADIRPHRPQRLAFRRRSKLRRRQILQGVAEGPLL